VAVALLVPLLSAVPTWHAYRAERPPDRVFLGFRFMAGDHYQYASFIRQAADEGRFAMENRFTTEPQKGRFVLLFLWITGMVGRVTGLGPPGAWEVMRIVSGAGLLLGIWALAGLCFSEPRGRLLAYLMVAFSGGVGWVLTPFQDLFPPIPGLPGMKDPFNFQWNWSTFASTLIPLWVAPSALFVGCLLVLLGGDRRPPWLRWAAGLLGLPAVWLMHPYTGFAAYAALVLFAAAPALGALARAEAIPWAGVRRSAAAALPFLASLVVVAAYVLWAREDPVFARTSRHGLLWSPAYSMALYPLSYGLLLPLALYGMRWSGGIPEGPRHVLGSWLGAAAGFAANPFFAGVKFQYLVHAPLALYAAHGVLELRRRSGRARALSRGIPGVLLGALLFVNAPLTLFKDLPATATDREIFLSEAEIDAMRFLETQPPGAVLCTERSGNRIPYLARKVVFLGHWFLTLDNAGKASAVSAFFDASVPAEAKARFLRDQRIRYVYYGPSERSLGPMPSLPGVETIYDRGGVAVHRAP
jgi:hypothetical protein